MNSTGCPGSGESIWVTAYTNDMLGNLLGVVQNGSHNRTFTYDSLSRMLTSNNPESGTITYVYNPDGTVASKSDQRVASTSPTTNMTTSYSYDALHRATAIVYNNGDTSVSYSYDGSSCLDLGSCQNIGHRTGMTDAAGSESWAYLVDTANSQSIHEDSRVNAGSSGNIGKAAKYYFNQSGDLTALVYPTGRIIHYFYDSAGRPANSLDASSGVTYATGMSTPPSGTSCASGGVCYTPQGTIYAMSLGQSSSFSGLNVQETYSAARLQPSEIMASTTATGTIMDLTYNFVDSTSGKNAGHVTGITNKLTATRTQTFGYDQVNRIISAANSASDSQCWGYGYSYDAWGNLLSQAGASGYSSCSGYTFSAAVNANNQIGTFSYDAAGNTLNDGINSYAWDAESQMSSAAGVSYAYDGDGRRVAKVGSKLYWYGSGGEILAETDALGNTVNEYVYFGGRRVALLPSSGAAQYYAADMLGSSRVMVNSATGAPCYDADFTPFGAEVTYASSCPVANSYKFEGKERDTETQNDEFGARYYSWRYGRWLSADWSSVPAPVPYANLNNPQTLNLYAMVSDDPESFADLDGHVPDYANSLSGFNAGSGVFIGSEGEAEIGSGKQATPPAAIMKGNQGGVRPSFTIKIDVWERKQDYAVVPSIIWSFVLRPAKPRTFTISRSPNNNVAHTAVAGSVALPVAPGIIFDIPFARTSTGKVCLGLGGGVGSPGVNVGAVHSSANIENVLSGASVSVSAQSGFVGAQTIHNQSGLAVGNSMGSPGVSLTVTYSWCF